MALKYKSGETNWWTMENGLEKSKTVTKTVFWLNICEICD